MTRHRAIQAAPAAPHREPLTKTRAMQILLQSREDIVRLMAKRFEDLEEVYRLLRINGELYEGITGEEAPEVRLRPELDLDLEAEDLLRLGMAG